MSEAKQKAWDLSLQLDNYCGSALEIELQDLSMMIKNETEDLQAQNTALTVEVERLQRAITLSISGLEYAAFNLCDQTRAIDNVMESTCPEATLRIELRDLKQALNNQKDS